MRPRWINRKLHRVRRHAGIKLCDLTRTLDWYLRGGKIFFERYYSEIAKAHKWSFIVGCNNSGTSLLQSILERTGQISTLPTEGMLYTTVLARSTKREHRRVWTEYLHQFQMNGADSIERAPRLLHDWMRDLPAPIHQIIVEKTPANAVRMEWLQKVFPRSYFIGLVRNGYAVAEGISRKAQKPIERSARHWNLVNKILIQEAKHIDNYIEIRYEDLVNNPMNVARRLSEFLDLDFGTFRDSMDHQFSFKTILGISPQPIRNLNAESIARLTFVDMRKVRENAAEMLDYFGYELPNVQGKACTKREWNQPRA